MAPTLSVFMVAGNRLLRETLVRVLKKKGDFVVCGASPGCSDVTASIVDSAADVLILDSLTARISEYLFISEVIRLLPKLKVLLIDMEDDPDIFLECVRAGAVGYLEKDACAAEIVSAVQSVARGHAVCPPHLCLRLFRTFAEKPSSVPNTRVKLEFGLTRRQQQLVPLIAEGLTNKEIATHLKIAEQTVKNHVHTILRRVGANGRMQVVDITRVAGAYR